MLDRWKGKLLKISKSTTKDREKQDKLKRKHLQYVKKNLLSVIDLAFTVFISSFILSLAHSITYIESFAPAKKKDHDRPLCNNHYSWILLFILRNQWCWSHTLHLHSLTQRYLRMQLHRSAKWVWRPKTAMVSCALSTSTFICSRHGKLSSFKKTQTKPN